MNASRRRPDGAPARAATGRYWAAGAVVACLALVGGCSGAAPGEAVGTATTASEGDTASAPAPTTPVPTPTTEPGPPASTAPEVGVTTLPPVAVGQEAAFGDGLVATVTAVDQVDLKGEGPGEVAGPGTAVRLQLRNGTTARVDLGGVVVSVTYGDGSPGDPSNSAPSDVPSGVLEPGASAEGVWVFSRPRTGAAPVEVTVGSQSSAAVVAVAS